MQEVLESVDRLMNRMEEKNYSRLLGLLATCVHQLDLPDDRYGTAPLKESVDEQIISDEEKAIMIFFLENKNTRPPILASLYSRTIAYHFRINYSF